jgi:hypothetical protein
MAWAYPLQSVFDTANSLSVSERCQMVDLLSDFVWHRNRRGYRLVDFNYLNLPWRFPADDPSRFIVPIGRATDVTKYRPFARGGDLCLVFARIRTADELLRFVNLYGPLTNYLGEGGSDWEYGDKDPNRGEPELVAHMSSSGVQGWWKCKDGTHVRANFIPADSVPEVLPAAGLFRRFLKFKECSKAKELASFLNTYDAQLFGELNQSSVDFVSDTQNGIRLRLCPPSLLSALWYQLGLKLSGESRVKTCRYCNEFFGSRYRHQSSCRRTILLQAAQGCIF